MTPTPVLNSTMTADRLDLAAGGSWTAAHADALERLIDAVAPVLHDEARMFARG